MRHLLSAVFWNFAERISTALITFKQQVRETKHHYSTQRRQSGKDKPFTELIHVARLHVVLKIGIIRRASAVKRSLAMG